MPKHLYLPVSRIFHAPSPVVHPRRSLPPTVMRSLSPHYFCGYAVLVLLVLAESVITLSRSPGSVDESMTTLTIKLALTVRFFFVSFRCEYRVVNCRTKRFSLSLLGWSEVCKAVRMHGRVIHIYKCCSLTTRFTAAQSPNTHLPAHTHTHIPNPPFIRRRRRLIISRAQATTPSTMSFHCQAISGPSSDATSLPADSSLTFELNQARHAKVTKEAEALKSGACPSVPHARNRISANRSHTLIHHRLNLL